MGPVRALPKYAGCAHSHTQPFIQFKVLNRDLNCRYRNPSLNVRQVEKSKPVPLASQLEEAMHFSFEDKAAAFANNWKGKFIGKDRKRPCR